MSKERIREAVEGVTIVSRHGIESELQHMRRAVERLPAHLRADIDELFCDSKSSTYLVALRRVENVEALALHLVRLRSTFIGFEYFGQRVLDERYPDNA